MVVSCGGDRKVLEMRVAVVVGCGVFGECSRVIESRPARTGANKNR
jgi:hypothetical protein